LLGIFSSLEAHSVQGGVEQLDAKWVLVDKKQWTGTEKRQKRLQGDIVLPFDLCLILVNVGSVGISWRADSREVVLGGWKFVVVRRWSCEQAQQKQKYGEGSNLRMLKWDGPDQGLPGKGSGCGCC
jgi:hypothetical protein